MDSPRKIMQFIGISLVVIVLARAFVLKVNQINAHELFSVPTAGASKVVSNTTSQKLSQKSDSDSETTTEETITITLEEEEEDSLRDESTIYSFLQGPGSWQNRYNWSGSWGELYTEEGAYFGGFACGLCCMANVYDTLSPYEASPVEVYQYAKDNSSYYPTSENSAISWDAMYSTLSKMGIESDLANNPADYETFKSEMENCETAVILIQSDDANSVWGATDGHYVNIWNYNPDDETVFVANPGGYTKNRQIITLQECYDYLKLASNYQVLYVRSYDESQDQWKHETISDENWVRPDYCIKE